MELNAAGLDIADKEPQKLNYFHPKNKAVPIYYMVTDVKEVLCVFMKR